MNESARFYKNPERFSDIEIIKKTPLGGGAYGEISQVIVRVGNVDRTFVLKEFKDRGKSAELFARRAFETHTKLKQAKLKVFPTYRLSEDGRSILMTSGHSEEFICLGTNKGSRSLKDFPEMGIERISAIEEFETFVNALFEQSALAGNQGFVLPEDTYFYLLDREPVGKVDFVIGDLDIVSEMEKREEACHLNGIAVYTSLYHFLKNNVAVIDDYILRLNNIYTKFSNGKPIPKVTDEEIRTVRKTR